MPCGKCGSKKPVKATNNIKKTAVKKPAKKTKSK
jgi:hypothetical protein